MTRAISSALVLCREAGDDRQIFSRKMESSPAEWSMIMTNIASFTRGATSASLPDPLTWRDDVGELGNFTGLQRKYFGDDEAGYIKAIATFVSPPRLPDTIPPLPDHFVDRKLVQDVISALTDTAQASQPRCAVLTGLGGAGKTLIASAVAHAKAVRHFFVDGVLWLSDSPEGYREQLLLGQLNSLAKQLRSLVLSRCWRLGQTSQYDDRDFKDLRRARNFLMWQRKYHLQCLLVLDNACNWVRRHPLCYDE